MIRASLAIALLLACSMARADPPADPQELLERGLRSYATGQYAEAIAAFRAGYQLDPRPDFLYALGQAQRLGGDCAAAVASYRAFLRTDPSERAAASARQNLERCEAQLPPPSPPAPQPGAMPAPPPAVVASAPNRRWQPDVAGAALTAVGLAVAGTGGALWGVGESGVQAANAAPRYDQFVAMAAAGRTAESERLAGILTFSAGAALLLSGIIRFAVVARRPLPR